MTNETPQPGPLKPLVESTRRENLMRLIERYGSQRAFAEAVGKAPAQVSQWVNQSRNQDGTPRQISDRSAREIERSLGLEPGWMDWPEDSPGPAWRRQTRPEPPVSAAVSDRATPRGYVRIAQYAVTAEAGRGGELMDYNGEVVRELEIARWWADRNLPRDLSRVRVLSARGDSMAPDIGDGDLLFVDTERRSVDGPGVYVLHWQGRALVKRLVPELRTGRLAIVSSNSAYPVEYVEPSEIDELHIGGRVSAAWTLRRF